MALFCNSCKHSSACLEQKSHALWTHLELKSWQTLEYKNSTKAINYCAVKVYTDSNNRLMKTVCNHSHLPEKEKLEVREAR